MSDSVGKISLDLELNSDLSKQIEAAAGRIGEQLKASLQNIGNLNFKGMADNMSNTLKKTIDSSMKGIQSSIEKSLNSAIAGAVSTAKKISIPVNFGIPTNSPALKVNTAGSTSIPRAPPAAKINTGVNFEAIKAQIDNLSISLDITNAKIEQQQEKLSRLKESYAMAFDGSRKNKLQEEILKTEATINKLTAASDKAGFKLADLDSRFASLSNMTKNATAGVSVVNEKINQTANAATKSSSSMKHMSEATHDMGNNFHNAHNSMGMFFGTMFKWGIIFPIIAGGIMSLGKYLGESLMVNSQFARSLIQIKTNLEVAFMPIYQVIVPALNSLMSALSRATAYFAAFINALFGKTYSASFGAANNLNASIANMQALEKQSKKTSSALGGIGSSADKSAKEAKGSLAGFDEINQLQLNKDSKDSGGQLPSMIAPDVDLSPMSTAMATINDMAAGFKKILATLFAPMKAAWALDGAGVMAEFHNAIEGTKATLNHFFEILATPPVQQFLENITRLALAIVKLGLKIYDNFILPILNWFIDLLPGAANGINPILEAVINFVNYLSGEGFPIVQFVLSGIIGLIIGIKAFQIGTKIAEMLGNIKNIVPALSELWMTLSANPIVLVIAIIAGLMAAFVALYASNEAFRNKVNEVGAAIKDFFAPVLQNIKLVLLDVWNNALVPLGDTLVDLWHTIIEPLATILKDVLAIAFTIVANVAKDLWNNVLVPLGAFLSEIFIKTIQSVIDIYNAWKPVIQGIIDAFMWLWKNVLDPIVKFMAGIFISTFKTVTSSIKDIIKGLKDIFGGLIDFITGTFTGDWDKAWTGVKSIFKGIFESLYGIVKAPLNLIIDAINAVISGLNRLHIDIPDWVTKITGISGTWGINIPQIPKLAKGGIIDQPTLAMVGEAGKEAVVPLENTEFVDTLASAVANAILAVMQFNKGNNQNNQDVRDIILQLDGTTIARILEPYLYKESQRIGNRLIIKTT